MQWAESHNFHLLSPTEEETHNRGNVLDLALGRGPLLHGAECEIATDLDTTSDHLPLLTTIAWNRKSEPLKRLRLDTVDKDLFRRLLKTSTCCIVPLPPHTSKHDLDILTESLIKAIGTAFNGSAQRSIGTSRGNHSGTVHAGMLAHSINILPVPPQITR